MPFTITHNGETIEVSGSDISGSESGYVFQTQDKYDEIISRIKRQARKDPEAEVAELKEKLAEAEKAEPTSADQLPEELRISLREKWETDVLSPIKEKLSKAESAANAARKQVLVRDIQTAAQQAGLQEHLLHSALDPTKPGYFVRELADTAQWNDKQGRWEFVDADGEVRMAEDHTKVAGAQHVIENLKENDKDFKLFSDERPQSTRTQQRSIPAPVRNGKVKVISMDEFNTLSSSERASFAADMEKGVAEIEA